MLTPHLRAALSSLSQIGYITLLCDRSGKPQKLDYVSKNCKRVVRSVRTAEVIAFMDAFDGALLISTVYEDFVNKILPFLCLLI